MTNKEMLVRYRENVVLLQPDADGNINFGQYELINKEYLLQLLNEKITGATLED